MDTIISIDTEIFFIINKKYAYDFIDPIMWFFSSKYVGIGLLILFSSFCVWKKRWELLRTALYVALAAAFADFTAYQGWKPFFSRLRPCHLDEELVRQIYGCGGTYGFPSNHATNLMLVAVMLGLFRGSQYLKYLLPAAALVGYSRIYLGVHYPLDVLAGFAYGGLIGFLAFRLLKKLGQKFPKIDELFFRDFTS